MFTIFVSLCCFNTVKVFDAFRVLIELIVYSEMYSECYLEVLQPNFSLADFLPNFSLTLKQ
jgi:hypothetical protein